MKFNNKKEKQNSSFNVKGYKFSDNFNENNNSKTTK